MPARKVDLTHRVCSSCRIRKPLTEEHFGRCKLGSQFPSQRWKYYCLPCDVRRNRAWKRGPKGQAYAEAHREEHRSECRKHHQKPEVKRRRRRQWTVVSHAINIVRQRWLRGVRAGRLPPALSACPRCGRDDLQMRATFPSLEAHVVDWACARCRALETFARRGAQPSPALLARAEGIVAAAREKQAHVVAKKTWKGMKLDPYEMSVALGLEEVLWDLSPVARRRQISRELERRRNPSAFGSELLPR